MESPDEDVSQHDEAVYKLEQSLTARIDGLVGEYPDVFTLTDLLGVLDVLKHKVLVQYSPYFEKSE